MFVTPAYAQAAAPGGGGAADLFIQLVPFVFILVIMWVLIIRPQRQQMKRHQEMVAALRRGDTVVTSGGLIGKVNKVVSDTELEVEISEGTRVRIVRSAVSEVRAKGEPAKDA
jgi:preprotein translocase subunit YajC